MHQLEARARWNLDLDRRSPPKPASISIAPTPSALARSRACPARRTMSTAPSPDGGIEPRSAIGERRHPPRSPVFSSTAVAQRLRIALVAAASAPGRSIAISASSQRDDVVLAARDGPNSSPTRRARHRSRAVPRLTSVEGGRNHQGSQARWERRCSRSASRSKARRFREAARHVDGGYLLEGGEWSLSPARLRSSMTVAVRRRYVRPARAVEDRHAAPDHGAGVRPLDVDRIHGGARIGDGIVAERGRDGLAVDAASDESLDDLGAGEADDRPRLEPQEPTGAAAGEQQLVALVEHGLLRRARRAAADRGARPRTSPSSGSGEAYTPVPEAATSPRTKAMIRRRQRQGTSA